MYIYNYISRTFLIMAVSMLCSFFGTILLANKVSTEAFGLLSLLKSLLPMCSMLLLLGIDKSYIKKYSNSEVEKVSSFLLPVIFIGGLLVSYTFCIIYNLDSYIFYIALCIIFGAINLFLASFARLKDFYGIAQIIHGGHKIAFLLLVIIFLVFLEIQSYQIILIYTLSLLLPSLYLFKYLKFESNLDGSLQFSDFCNLYKYGLLFFSANILNLLIVNMERLILPFVYGNEVLGVYTALTYIYITIFTMIGSSIGYVLFPELSKKNLTNYKKLILISSLIILFFSIIFYLFGYQINSIIYNYKFDSWRSYNIDIMIIIIGALQFLNGIMHWFILGLGDKKQIIGYLKIIFFVLITYFISMCYVTIDSKVNYDTILSIVLFGWILKVICTFYYIRRIKIFYVK